MSRKTTRIAARAVIVIADKVLLVNAWPDGRSALLCAPGGGVETGQSLPHNLAREVFEETGLTIEVQAPCLVNEFHDPKTGFHQIEIFFHCLVVGSDQIDPAWQDPERIVTKHVWANREDLKTLMVKPDALAGVAFEVPGALSYDPLEQIVV